MKMILYPGGFIIPFLRHRFLRGCAPKVTRIFIFLLIPILLHAQSQIPPYQISTCTSCHGLQGVSPNPAWPNIAGQHRHYLIKTLQDIKAGKTRDVPVMSTVVAPLTETDIIAIANYYSHLPLSIGRTPNAYVKQGEKLYRGGNRQKQIAACIACHGPGGEGNDEAGYPALSGQQAEYTIQQLQLFKTHARQNDLNSIMQDLSHRLDDEEMKALAYYMQGLYPTGQFEHCCTKR